MTWLLGKMSAAESGGGDGADEGKPDVATRLRTEVPAAFWARGCDPAPLGIDEAARPEGVAVERETRHLAVYDDPLFDDL